MTRPDQGLSSLALGGREEEDPGNEVRCFLESDAEPSGMVVVVRCILQYETIFTAVYVNAVSLSNIRK